MVHESAHLCEPRHRSQQWSELFEGDERGVDSPGNPHSAKTWSTDAAAESTTTRSLDSAATQHNAALHAVRPLNLHARFAVFAGGRSVEEERRGDHAVWRPHV